MALPLIAGLPWLAGIIVSAISGLVGFFGQWMTRRFALLAAAVTAIVTVTGAFVLAVEALLAGIYYASPDIAGAWLIIPSNFTSCVAAILSAKVLRYAYDWNIRIIQLRLF